MSDKLKSENAAFTLMEVGKLIEKAFNMYKSNNPILEKATFYREYPIGQDPEKLELPAITYKIEAKTPSSEIKTRQRESIPDPNNEGHHIEIRGRTYKGRVRFDIWANQNYQVDEIADEFEGFITAFTGFFQEQGLKEVLYEGTYSDKPSDFKDNVLHSHISYSLILEQQYVTSYKDIEDIKIKISNIH